MARSTKVEEIRARRLKSESVLRAKEENERKEAEESARDCGEVLDSEEAQDSEENTDE